MDVSNELLKLYMVKHPERFNVTVEGKPYELDGVDEYCQFDESGVLRPINMEAAEDADVTFTCNLEGLSPWV